MSSTRSPSNSSAPWIAWAAICVIWGTTYLAIKIALDTVPPFTMGGLRYAFAGTALAVILRALGHRLPPPSHWRRLSIISFFMLVLGNGGVVWGEQFVPSGLTAVLIATSPFWMVGVDAMVSGGRQLHARQWAGLTIGFAGIVILVWPDIVSGGAGGRGFIAGVISVQVACAGWAVGSAYTRRHVVAEDVLGSAALQMVFGGILMLLLGGVLGEWPRLGLNARTGLALTYLSIAGSVVAFAAYSYALRHLDVAIVSLYTYVNPVIAVALGTIVLGEPFNARMIVAAAVIVAGVVVVGKRR